MGIFSQTQCYFSLSDLDCAFVWTGGYALSPWSSVYAWNMTSHTKPANYLPWDPLQIFNFFGPEDYILILSYASTFYFGDAMANVEGNPWFRATGNMCYICEYTPWP